MQLGTAQYTYEWIDKWARVPDNETSRINGRTHGVVVTHDGQIIVFHKANPAVLTFDANGQLKGAWGDRFLGGHGMTLVREQDPDYLWLTDERSRDVVKTTFN